MQWDQLAGKKLQMSLHHYAIIVIGAGASEELISAYLRICKKKNI